MSICSILFIYNSMIRVKEYRTKSKLLKSNDPWKGEIKKRFFCDDCDENKRQTPTHIKKFFCTCLCFSLRFSFSASISRFDLVSLVSGISTNVDYLIPKPSFKKNSSGNYLRHSREHKGFIPFPRVFAPKWT